MASGEVMFTNPYPTLHLLLNHRNTINQANTIITGINDELGFTVSNKLHEINRKVNKIVGRQGLGIAVSDLLVTVNAVVIQHIEQ